MREKDWGSPYGPGLRREKARGAGLGKHETGVLPVACQRECAKFSCGLRAAKLCELASAARLAAKHFSAALLKDWRSRAHVIGMIGKSLKKGHSRRFHGV